MGSVPRTFTNRTDWKRPEKSMGSNAQPHGETSTYGTGRWEY